MVAPQPYCLGFSAYFDREVALNPSIVMQKWLEQRLFMYLITQPDWRASNRHDKTRSGLTV